jgi:uncharacterized OsmC-like protein
LPIPKSTLKKAVVNATLREGFTVECKAGNHVILQDLPKTVGGTDRGPSPTELVLASLAGCIGIVARFHAPRLGINLKGLEIVVEGTYDVRGFMGEDVKPGFTSIATHVKVDAEGATDEDIKKFINFVEAHCPVSDTLKSNVDVRISFERVTS